MDRNMLAQILSGGGRGDPYANQAAGPFATSPRITQHGSGSGGGAKPAPAKAASGKPKAKASGSKSASRSKPKGGGQYNMPVPTPRPEFNPLQNAVDSAPTGAPPNPLQAAVDNAPTGAPPNPLQAAVDAAGRGYPSIAQDQGAGLPQPPIQQPMPPHSQTPFRQPMPPHSMTPFQQPMPPHSQTPFQQPMPPHSMPPLPNASDGANPDAGFWWQGGGPGGNTKTGQPPGPKPPLNWHQGEGPGVETALFGQPRDRQAGQQSNAFMNWLRGFGGQ